MSDLTPAQEFAQHPAVRNYGPDTPYDFDQEPWFRLVAANRAEQLGITDDQAREFIKRNGVAGDVGNAEWTRPRDENVPLSRTVEDD